MGCDLIVALGPATASRATLFGLNGHASGRTSGRLVLNTGNLHASDEKIRARFLDLPQCRHTFTTLGYQADGAWGYQHGVNEHQLAVGCARWHSLLRNDHSGLDGADLVRLVLERAGSARQGIDVLTELICRHGQGAYSGEGADRDHTFLLADPNEAFVLEAAGRFWAMQQIGQVRAVSDVAVIRQDWNRLSPGLSDVAIKAGHWPADGSKLDFAGAVSLHPAGQESALRRWGRATVLLESQNGHIDAGFLRHVLGDHYEGSRFEVDPLSPASSDPLPLCRHESSLANASTRTSCIAELTASNGAPQVVWHAFGPPCLSVYFPFLLMPCPASSQFPDALAACAQTVARLSNRLYNYLDLESDRWQVARERLGWLQVRYEEETAELLQALPARDKQSTLADALRQVEIFQQRVTEQFEDIVQDMARQPMASPFTPAFR